MSLAVQLHTVIEEYNVLKTPTDQIYAYLLEHPKLYKAALLVDHVFRAAAMLGLKLLLPFSELVNLSICFFSALFYRLTAETLCAYKFALPAFAGSVAIALAQTAIADLISGVALASLSAFGLACLSLVSLAVYVVYIVLTVSYDVDVKCEAARLAAAQDG